MEFFFHIYLHVKCSLILFYLLCYEIFQIDVDIATHISIADDGPNRR